jgi:DNA-binding XRE family transcriptional regulator
MDLASKVGLKSRGQIADIERGRETPSAEIAIKIDRLSGGLVPVHELRPDLHDVRVVRPEGASA